MESIYFLMVSSKTLRFDGKKNNTYCHGLVFRLECRNFQNSFYRSPWFIKTRFTSKAGLRVTLESSLSSTVHIDSCFNSYSFKLISCCNAHDEWSSMAWIKFCSYVCHTNQFASEHFWCIWCRHNLLLNSIAEAENGYPLFLTMIRSKILVASSFA